ncbi:MAG TPA: hypothetical protein VHB48_09535 [Chitinophagaceae bacterium]|nr:hypothetical protein [Chitinophagaceae bacterium]
MKKLLFVLAIAAFAACGSGSDASKGADTSATMSADTTTKAADTTAKPADTTAKPATDTTKK